MWHCPVCGWRAAGMGAAMTRLCPDCAVLVTVEVSYGAPWLHGLCPNPACRMYQSRVLLRWPASGADRYVPARHRYDAPFELFLHIHAGKKGWA